MALDRFSVPSYITKYLKDMGYTPDTSMTSHIENWYQWYTRSAKFYNVEFVTATNHRDKRTRRSIKPAKRASKEWASLLLNEDTIISAEASGANTWLTDYLKRNKFWPNGQMAIEKSFALGTGAWALWFDVVSDRYTDIKIRRYDARMIIPLSWDEDGVSECAFVTRISIKGKRADQLQIHAIDGSTYHILTRVWVEEKEINYDAHGIITDFDTECKTKTFAIIKPGEENTCVDLSPFGMSIFEDAIDAIQAVDLTFDMTFQEVDLTGIKVFMDEQMLELKDKNGRMTPMSRQDKSLFRRVLGKSADDFIEVFSPNIRIDAYEKALNIALAEFGDLTGFGEQYFKIGKDGGLKTATEVTSDNSVLMRNIKKHENVLRGAIQDIITSLLTCARIHSSAPVEEDFGAINVEFDDSIIIDTQAEKMLMMAEIQAGVVPKWMYAVKFHGMTEEEAKAALPQSVYEEGM